MEAAGPVASSDIRTEINEHSGLVYPDPAFVDQVMNWSPTPGYTPDDHAGTAGRMVQPDLLTGVMAPDYRLWSLGRIWSLAIARTSAGERPCARSSRRVVARSRLAKRRPEASVSSGWWA